MDKTRAVMTYLHRHEFAVWLNTVRYDLMLEMIDNTLPSIFFRRGYDTIFLCGKIEILIWCICRSKPFKETYAGVLGESPDLPIHVWLEKYTTILQAKMLVKLRSTKQNIRRQDSDKHIYKCFESKRVLWKDIRLAMLYFNTKKQSKHTDWLPRHLGIQGYEENDLDKRRGTQNPFMSKSTA